MNVSCGDNDLYFASLVSEFLCGGKIIKELGEWDVGLAILADYGVVRVYLIVDFGTTEVDVVNIIRLNFHNRYLLVLFCRAFPLPQIP